MEQRNNEQNSVILQIDGILNKMSNQVNFLIRNNKLMNQLDVDLLMENTRKLYDTLCSVKCNMDVDSIPMEVEEGLEGEEEHEEIEELEGQKEIEDDEEAEGLEDFDDEDEFEGLEDFVEEEDLEGEEGIEDDEELEDQEGIEDDEELEDEEDEDLEDDFESSRVLEFESSIQEEYEEFERDFEEDIEEGLEDEEEQEGLEDEEEHEEIEDEEGLEDDEELEEQEEQEDEEENLESSKVLEFEDSVPEEQDSGIRAYKKVYTIEPHTLGDKLEAAEDTSLAARLQRKPVADLAAAIGINDKFLLLNELFGGSMEKYNKSIRALNNFSTLLGAKTYMSELQIEFQWDCESDAYKKLDNLVERRFM